MELTGILVKTPRGVNEIQTRANRLAQKRRNLLILIDGNASVEDMLARFPTLDDIEQSLQELVDEGYAELKVGTAASAASTAAAAVANAPTFDEAARALSRTLRDLVGPTADDFTGELESARDRAGFLRAARSSVMIVESFEGGKKAELFLERALAIANRFFKE